MFCEENTAVVNKGYCFLCAIVCHFLTQLLFIAEFKGKVLQHYSVSKLSAILGHRYTCIYVWMSCEIGTKLYIISVPY